MKLLWSFLLMVLSICIVTCEYYPNSKSKKSKSKKIYEEKSRPRVTEIVFFGIEIDGRYEGAKIGIGLFGEVCPNTVKNFKELARRPEGEGYKGSRIHRVIKGFMIQGGDFVYGNGSGGYSIYGHRFNDENFEINHYGAGWLSMANSGRDSNGSQFFITLAPTPWLDGSHVVFGKVVTGMEYVRMIEEVEVDEENHPEVDVVITNSGWVPISKPTPVDMTDAVDLF